LGALKGSISFSKFYVRDALPEGFRDTFVERIRLRAFQPLTVEDDAETRLGWCSIENPLDCELDHGKIFFNSYLNLGLRTDRWQIPAPLFKAHFQEAEREHLQKRGRDKLGRREKEELRAVVSRRLRAQILPVMKVIDLSWNLETGVVRFWNQSSRVHEGLGELFEETFELALVPESPFTAAREIGLSEAHARAFEALKPAVFHTPCPSGDLLWTSSI
jgi:recombination associated protein RdgC